MNGKRPVFQLVKYNNTRIEELDFSSLRKVDFDFFWAILYKTQQQKSNRIELSREELMQIPCFKNKRYTKKGLADDLKIMSQRVQSLNMTVEKDDGGFMSIVFFPSFDYSVDSEKMVVEIHDKFSSVFRNVRKNYSWMELEILMRLESIYSKRMFLQLTRFRHTGFWKIDHDAFKTIMQVPKTYTSGQIKSKVIDIVQKELLTHYDELGNTVCSRFEYEIVKSGTGKTAKILGYRFSFELAHQILPYLLNDSKSQDSKDQHEPSLAIEPNTEINQLLTKYEGSAVGKLFDVYFPSHTPEDLSQAKTWLSKYSLEDIERTLLYLKNKGLPMGIRLIEFALMLPSENTL